MLEIFAAVLDFFLYGFLKIIFVFILKLYIKKKYLSIEITYHLFIAAKIHSVLLFFFSLQNNSFHHSPRERTILSNNETKNITNSKIFRGLLVFMAGY